MVGKFHKKWKHKKWLVFPQNILSVFFLIKSLNITINNVLADLGCKRRRIFSFIHWNWNFRFFLKIWLSPPTSLILRSTIFKIVVYCIPLCCFFNQKWSFFQVIYKKTKFYVIWLFFRARWVPPVVIVIGRSSCDLVQVQPLGLHIHGEVASRRRCKSNLILT